MWVGIPSPTPQASFIPTIVTKENARNCKGEIWQSNGVGAGEGKNCPQGRLCCEMLVSRGRSLTLEEVRGLSAQ
jgi:hypothetical protein